MLFYPVYAFLLKYVRKRAIASLITLLVIVIIILGPISYLSFVLAQEVQSIASLFKNGFDPGQTILGMPFVKTIIGKILSIFSVSEADFLERVGTVLSRFGREYLGQVAASFGGLFTAGLDFLFMLFALFFLFEDGPELVAKLGNYLPFAREHRHRLVAQTRGIVISTIYGGVAVAIGQALIGGLAFFLLGVPSAVFWAMTMFICSFIPIVGTFLIWGPAALYLFMKVSVVKGIILVAVGVLGISMVDNILRPLIIRGRTKMPMLLILFGILGGIKFFGFIGFIMGPLVIALFISVLEAFRYPQEGQAKG
jgi:predicted PurR-regulated permease PerM